MTQWEPRGAVEEALAALSVHDASGDSVERIRRRCLTGLAARRRTEGVGRGWTGTWRTWLEPALALGLGALYLAEAARSVLAVYR